MKKLIYLLIAMAVLGLIVSGCLPVVPPTEQGDLNMRSNGSATWYVDASAEAGGNGTTSATTGVSCAFQTISTAITAATVADGDTIIVADGTYIITVAINVNKEVTITGNIDNPESVLVKYSSTVTDKNCFDITVDNVKVQGIKAINGKRGFYLNGVTGCKVSNCIVSSCADQGIYVRLCTATSEAERVEVTSNVISDCGNTWNVACIQVYQSPYTYVYNNTISSTDDKGINIWGPNATNQAEMVIVEGNIISGCPWPAIQVIHDRYTYIYNNTISSCDDKGISIANGENVGSSAQRIVVEGNTVSGTKWPGIQVSYGIDYTYIHNNTVTGCNYYGGDGTGDWDYASIHVDSGCENTVVDGNTVSDGINGIQLWSDDCTVTNNEIYDMGLTYKNTKTTIDGTYYNSAILYGDMYGVNMPTSATISNNNIHDNYWGLFVISTYTGTVTAKNNWWGHASGPSGEGGRKNKAGKIIGKGDAVSLWVDWDPWLPQPVGHTPHDPVPPGLQ
jgi:parallel beta-helix repeat protein